MANCFIFNYMKNYEIASIIFAMLVFLNGCVSSLSADQYQWKTYESLDFEFKYPDVISVKKEGEKIILLHSVPYEHPDLCDLRGKSQALADIVDFSVSFEIIQAQITTIDGTPIKLGNLQGIEVFNGAHGCGTRDYYLYINGSRILKITRKLVP